MSTETFVQDIAGKVAFGCGAFLGEDTGRLTLRPQLNKPGGKPTI